MNINDIEESLLELNIEDRKYVLGSFTPLIKNVISSGRLSASSIPKHLEFFGILTNDLDIENVFSTYKVENYQGVEERFFKLQNALLGLENYFIFFESTTENYIKRSKLSFANKIKNNFNLSSLLIRRIALVMCESYGDKITLFHNTNKIHVGSQSSIYCNRNVEIWFDYSDLSRIIGNDWQNKISLLFDNILLGISNLYQLEFSMLKAPYNAVHVKLTKK